MVKLQFLLHCFINNVWLSDSELEVLTLAAIQGYSKQMIKDAVSLGIFKSEQSVRNCTVKLMNLGLLIKVKGKTRIINPNITVGIDDTIILDMKFANV